MARVAFLVDRTFDDEQLRRALERMKDAGQDVVIVGGCAGDSVHGREGRVHVEVDETVDEISLDTFSALVVPGGFPANHLRTHERLLNFIRDMYAEGKPVAVMRPPGWVLVPAAHNAPRPVTWPRIKRDLIIDQSPEAVQELAGAGAVISREADPEAMADAVLAEIGHGVGLHASAFNPEVAGDPVARVYGPEPAPPGR